MAGEKIGSGGRNICLPQNGRFLGFERNINLPDVVYKY